MKTKIKPLADETRILSWSSLGHLVVSTSLQLIIVILWALGAIDFSPEKIILFLLPAYMAIAFLGTAVPNRFCKRASKYVYFQLAASLVIISAIIQYTGQNHNAFMFLYFIPIINASVISTQLTASLVFVSTALYIFYEFAESLVFRRACDPNFLGGDEIISLSLLALIGVIIAFQTMYHIPRSLAQNHRTP